MIIKPLKNIIIVQELNKPKSSSLFEINSTSEKECFGKVIAVNENEKTVALNEVVLFNKFAGFEIMLNSTTHYAVDIEDCLAIIKGEENE